MTEAPAASTADASPPPASDVTVPMLPPIVRRSSNFCYDVRYPSYSIPGRVMPSATSTQQKSHLTATLLLSCLAQFMVILDVSVVNVALPSIRNGLHFTENNLQWVVNAYTVTFAGFLLLGGRAADLLGRRRVFVFGLLLFALASVAGGLAESQGMLIAARAVQGLGGAVIAPASLSILTTTFEEV